MVVGPILDQRPDEEMSDPVMAALNSPPGALAESVLNRIDAREGTTASDVPDAIWNRMTRLLHPETAWASHAATILASRLGNLFKRNPDWVRDHFIRKFNWANNPNAAVLWQGYFWQLLLPNDLWPLIKPDFLAAVGHSDCLGNHAKSAASWFTVICVDRPAFITHTEATEVLQNMSPRYRGAVAQVLRRRLEQASSADQLWRDKIGPWLRTAWPRKQNLIESSPSLYLSLAAVTTRDEFPNAVETIREFAGASPDYSVLIEVVKAEHAQLVDLHPRELLELVTSRLEIRFFGAASKSYSVTTFPVLLLGVPNWAGDGGSRLRRKRLKEDGLADCGAKGLIRGRPIERERDGQSCCCSAR